MLRDDPHHQCPHARRPGADVDHARGLRCRAPGPRLLGRLRVPRHRRAARGRRHDVHRGSRQRPVLRGHRAARAVDRRTRARRARRRRSVVLAASHQRRPAPLAGAGEGRHPPRDRGARERGVGSVGSNRRQAALAPGVRPDARTVRREHRLPVSHRRARPRRGARPARAALAPTRQRASPSSSATGIPRTSRRPGGSATTRRRCATCAGRRSPTAGDASRPRSASTSPATCAAAR